MMKIVRIILAVMLGTLVLTVGYTTLTTPSPDSIFISSSDATTIPNTWLLFPPILLTIVLTSYFIAGPKLLDKPLAAIRSMGGKWLVWADVLIAISSFVFFIGTAFWIGRPTSPTWHDHFMYLTQAQLIGHGHLWLPAHALPDFFDTFFILVKPVYAPMYFPGTGIVFSIALLLGIPWWIWSAGIMSACCVITFRIGRKLYDPLAGFVVVIGLLGLPVVRHLSFVVQSHSVLLFFYLLGFLAWLYFRESGKRRWLILLGICAGMSAITRPLEASGFFLAIGIPLLCDLMGQPIKTALRTVIIPCSIAMCFVSVQFYFNHAVTGSWLRTPISLYAEQSVPGVNVLGNVDTSSEHAIDHLSPQKQVSYLKWSLKDITKFHNQSMRDHVMDRVGTTLNNTLSHTLLGLLLPFGVLAMTDRRRVALGMGVVFYLIGFTFYFTMLYHYTAQVAPAILLMVVGGIVWIEQHVRQRWVIQIAWLAIPVAAILSTPFVENYVNPIPNITDGGTNYLNLSQNRENLLQTIDSPSIVFCSFDPQHDFVNEEYVYNIQAPRIDDNRVIFAHDLGKRNIELLRYYSKVSPQRVVYEFRPSPTASLKRIGTVEQVIHERFSTTILTESPPSTR